MYLAFRERWTNVIFTFYFKTELNEAMNSCQGRFDKRKMNKLVTKNIKWSNFYCACVATKKWNHKRRTILLLFFFSPFNICFIYLVCAYVKRFFLISHLVCKTARFFTNIFLSSWYGIELIYPRRPLKSILQARLSFDNGMCLVSVQNRILER